MTLPVANTSCHFPREVGSGIRDLVATGAPVATTGSPGKTRAKVPSLDLCCEAPLCGSVRGNPLFRILGWPLPHPEP